MAALHWARKAGRGSDGKETRICDIGFGMCKTDAGVMTDTRRSLIASRMCLSFRYGLHSS